MPYQQALTIDVPVKAEQLEALRQLLEQMGQDAANNAVLPLGNLPGTHFARLLILDRSTDQAGKVIPASLIFISECDAPLDRYMERLVDAHSEGLDRIFSFCEGYPAGPQLNRASRLAFLQARSIKTAAFYVNTVGRTVEQVRQEARLREAIENYLDSRSDWGEMQPLQVRAEIQNYLRSQPEFSWASRPAAGPSLFFRLREALHLVAFPLVALLLAPFALLLLPIFLVILRIKEMTDPVDNLKPTPDHIRELAALEDKVVQNQFSAVGYIKPGWFRQLIVMVVLLGVDWVVRHIFNNGNLAGVKTIHFARWVTLNENRWVIFTSNYDGSLESYMDDFIDKVAWGLNGVFSNGVGYPKTDFLVMGGAQNEQAFKNYLRRHQIPTQVWYSAYHNLSTLNISQNSRIRAGLNSNMNSAQAEEWLSLL
ncbi:MAG TPA: hypothetical protein VH186_12505 [Chloroflexia bacterium]|nr:hypothetical protein [Chloroflexia bacterium]